jgi:predicted aconitase with swiveling domain
MANGLAEAGWSFKTFVDGVAHGQVLVSTEPISFAGDFDAASGTIVRQRSALYGQSLAGKILVYAYGRGSSSTSSIIAEALRLGTAPAAIVNVKVEHILVVGALVAGSLFDATMPIVSISADTLAELNTGDRLRIDTRQGLFHLDPAVD